MKVPPDGRVQVNRRRLRDPAIREAQKAAQLACELQPSSASPEYRKATARASAVHIVSVPHNAVPSHCLEGTKIGSK